MKTANDIIEKIRRRFGDAEIVGMKREDFETLAAEIEGREPKPFEVIDKENFGDHVKRSFAKQVQFNGEEAKAEPYTLRSVL